MDHRQKEDMSFGEKKLVQGSEQTGSIFSVLLHALQRVTLAGLVSRASHPCSSTLVKSTPVPAEAAACYLGNLWISGVDSIQIAAHSCKPSRTIIYHRVCIQLFQGPASCKALTGVHALEQLEIMELFN